MLARLQQFTTLALVAIAMACAAFLASRGKPFWAFAAVALVAAGHAILLAFEFLFLASANREDPAPAATAGELIGGRRQSGWPVERHSSWPVGRG